MNVVLEKAGLVDFKSSEVGVASEFVSGDHFVGAHGHNTAILPNEFDHTAESIQLREVFALHRVVLLPHD